MKKLLLLLSSVVCLLTVHAQLLYGTASDGGINGKGTIAQLNISTSALNAVFTFETLDGVHPQFSNLAPATDGKLYGMTRYGGSNNAGILFSYNPATATYARLKDFDITNGGYPYGSLMQAADGKLYGMTTYGGSNNAGVIFSFDPLTAIYTKLKDLDVANGAYPYGQFIQATDGKLYGMASYGGTKNTGVIFSFDPATNTYIKLKDFDGGTGGSPYGSLMQAADGKLYGMTTYGGSGGYGVIFSFVPATSTYTKLKDLDFANGGNPYGRLMQATNGKLYGMTYTGGFLNGGVIFSFDPVSNIYTRVRDFKIANGGNPYGRLMQATDGKLYGTTSSGGTNGGGIIFSFDPNNNAAYAKLKDLDNANGSNPQGDLVLASNGKMYSMTTNGGSGDNGVIFCFDPASTTYTKVKDFGSNNYGSNVYAGVIKNAADGKLYGMTEGGGSYGDGLIYCFDPSTSALTNVHNFTGADGGNPYGRLLQAADGKLYGMTYSGGSGYGVIFSFDAATGVYTKLYAFDYNNGGNPTSDLMQASNGKLYGMTYYGGSNGSGVIFSFDPATATYTKLYDFNGTNGAYPYGSLMQFTDGKLYGMTYYGGKNGAGVLFLYDPAVSTFKKLKDLGGTLGGNPSGNLMLAGNGKMYAMTRFGGNNNYGVIFTYNPAAVIFTKLKDFDGTNGGNPYGSLMQAADGKLYGVTYAGGNYNDGVVFSFAPSNSTYTKIQDFDGNNGKNPQYVTLTELACVAAKFFRDADGDGFGDVNNSIINCVQPAGYVRDSTDCNDNNANEKPGQTWYIDADGDGYSGSSLVQCARPANGFLLTELTGGTGDCNDSNASIHPGATEIPDDGIDQNCDGYDLKTWYADADGDGYGNAAVSITANTQPAGYVANSADCDDTKLLYADADNDGFGAGNPVACGINNNTDCNDGDNTIYPGAPELCDGKDNNCDGTIDEGCTIPNLRISDASITEGNSGTQLMNFTVSLSAASAQTITVSYQTKNVTATAPSDYIAQSGSLSFAPGVKKQTVAIVINGDVVNEPDETFKVILSNAVNASFGDNTGIGTILNDDAGSIKAGIVNNTTYSMRSLSVSPNPATSLLTVQLAGFAGNVTLQLTDLQGKVLTEAALQTSNTKYAQQQLNVSGIASGTYFIVATDEKGNKQTQKVVVSH